MSNLMTAQTPVSVGGFSAILGHGRGRGSIVRQLPGEAASRMILAQAKQLPANDPYHGDLSRLTKLPESLSVVLSTPWFLAPDGREKRWHIGVAQGGAARHEWQFLLFSANKRNGVIKLETGIKSRALSEPLDLLNDAVARKLRRGYQAESKWRPFNGYDFLAAVRQLASDKSAAS